MIEVSKIVVKMGDVSVELSLEEARELQRLLNDTFGKQVYIPTVIPYPVYPQPYRYWDRFITWDGTDTSGNWDSTGGGTMTYELTC